MPWRFSSDDNYLIRLLIADSILSPGFGNHANVLTNLFATLCIHKTNALHNCSLIRSPADLIPWIFDVCVLCLFGVSTSCLLDPG